MCSIIRLRSEGENSAHLGRSWSSIELQRYEFFDPFGFEPSRGRPNGSREFLERSGQLQYLDERDVFAGW
jgi:hypothetical protein